MNLFCLSMNTIIWLLEKCLSIFVVEPWCHQWITSVVCGWKTKLRGIQSLIWKAVKFHRPEEVIVSGCFKSSRNFSLATFYGFLIPFILYSILIRFLSISWFWLPRVENDRLNSNHDEWLPFSPPHTAIPAHFESILVSWNPVMVHDLLSMIFYALLIYLYLADINSVYQLFWRQTQEESIYRVSCKCLAL